MALVFEQMNEVGKTRSFRPALASALVAHLASSQPLLLKFGVRQLSEIERARGPGSLRRVRSPHALAFGRGCTGLPKPRPTNPTGMPGHGF